MSVNGWNLFIIIFFFCVSIYPVQILLHKKKRIGIQKYNQKKKNYNIPISTTHLLQYIVHHLPEQ